MHPMPRHFRVGSLAALAGLLALSPRMAGDEPASADARTPKGDRSDQPIDLARKDLQALRAPGASLEGRADLPKIDMPSMSLVPFQRAPLDPSKASAESGKRGLNGEVKSGDWLLKAMEEGEPPGSPSGPRDRNGRAPAEAVRQPALDGEAGQAGSAEGQSAEPPKPADRHVDNPLNAYMTQWISPREQGVLLPMAAGGAPADGAAASGSGAPFASNLNESMEGSGAQSLPEIAGISMSREAAGPAAAVAQPSNPYLSALEAPLGIASVQTTLPPPPSGGFLQGTEFHLGRELPPAPVPGLGADPRSGIPDFARPSEDDRAFKQLKKF